MIFWIPFFLDNLIGEILVGLRRTFCCHATGEMMPLLLSMWIKQQRYDSNVGIHRLTFPSNQYKVEIKAHWKKSPAPFE